MTKKKRVEVCDHTIVAWGEVQLYEDDEGDIDFDLAVQDGVCICDAEVRRHFIPDDEVQVVSDPNKAKKKRSKSG